MSELDEKLRNIHKEQWNAALASPSGIYSHDLVMCEKFLHDIKQAFADAGYFHDDVTEVARVFREDAGNGNPQREFLLYGVKYMTGDAWYEKFLEEAGRKSWIAARDHEWAFVAARKAAGIDHD